MPSYTAVTTIASYLLGIALLLILVGQASGANHPPAPPKVKVAIAKTFQNHQVRKHFECITWHESRYRKAATGAAGEVGLAQIHWGVHRNWIIPLRGSAAEAKHVLRWNLTFHYAVAKRIFRDAWNRRGVHRRFEPWTTRGLCGAR